METWPEVFQFFRNILKNQFQSCDKSCKTDTETSTDATPHLWTDLVKNFTRKQRHALSFSLECTDFKNVIFEKIPWAPSEDAEVAEVKQPRNSKRWKL